MGKRTAITLISLLILLLLAGCSGAAAPTPTIVPTAVVAPEVVKAIEVADVNGRSPKQYRAGALSATI